MSLFKAKLGDKVYELDRLTLGDGVVLKRQFNVTDLENFNPADPETLVGLLTLAVMKTDGVSLEQAQALVSDVSFDDVDIDDKDEADNPQVAPVSEATVSPA
jgi:hypothetical protein